MRLTIAWTLNVYIYFLNIVLILMPFMINESFHYSNIISVIIGTLIFLLICSILNFFIIKKFFPYPKGEFVNQIKEEFKKEPLSERIYIIIRDGFIPAIVLITIGTIVNTTIRGRTFDLLDLIIIGTPLCFILILRILFRIYQTISNKKSDD